MRYFTRDHEWIEVGDDSATVGITDYAQGQLGDIVFVEVPASGTKLTKGGAAAVVESVKAASDVYSPVSGVVGSGNPSLEGDPSLVNTAADGDGWFFTIVLEDANELEGLMDRAGYDAYVAGL